MQEDCLQHTHSEANSLRSLRRPASEPRPNLQHLLSLLDNYLRKTGSDLRLKDDDILSYGYFFSVLLEIFYPTDTNI